MKVEYINAFITSIRAVFDKMVKVPITLGRPYLKRADERLYKLYKVGAVIRFYGAGIGCIVFGLTEPAALMLASGLAGQKFDHLDPDCYDALGEIASMVAGGAKKEFTTGQINLSMPQVLKMANVPYPQNIPVICIPADTGAGRFVLEIAYRDLIESPATHDAGASPETIQSKAA